MIKAVSHIHVYLFLIESENIVYNNPTIEDNDAKKIKYHYYIFRKFPHYIIIYHSIIPRSLVL